jgi:glycosyltransferase involved in cell wall biosynthesis
MTTQHINSQVPELSIVIPMYNEGLAIGVAVRTIIDIVQNSVDSLEIVCVDDGSTDSTANEVRTLGLADSRVKLVELSRNFGKEGAMTAGIDYARGRAVVIMDADLQHPPSAVPDMIRLWREGYEVVDGVKRQRAKESFLYRLFAKTFNSLMAEASGVQFRGASDFKLLDRRVVDTLRLLPERERFFRGLVAWLGFRTVIIEFDVHDRVAGETKWSIIQLIRYSIRNLLAFSSLPLQAIATLGVGTLVFSAIFSGWALFRYLRGDALTGFTTVILLQLILGGLLLVGMGTIALYISAIFRELKGRPAYVSVQRPVVVTKTANPISNSIDVIAEESSESLDIT